MKFRAEDLAGANLAKPASFPEIKAAWVQATQQAEDLFSKLPMADIGCLYLNKYVQPISPDPLHPDFPTLPRHFGSVGGAWPKLA